MAFRHFMIEMRIAIGYVTGKDSQKVYCFEIAYNIRVPGIYPELLFGASHRMRDVPKAIIVSLGWDDVHCNGDVSTKVSVVINVLDSSGQRNTSPE